MRRCWLVPARFVLELAQLEIAAQLAVDAAEQIEIESAGDAGGIVVGHQHAVAFLYQVGADQQRVAGKEARGGDRAETPSAHGRSKLPMVLPRNSTRSVSPDWRSADRARHPIQIGLLRADALRRGRPNRARNAPGRRRRRRSDSSAGRCSTDGLQDVPRLLPHAAAEFDHGDGEAGVLEEAPRSLGRAAAAGARRRA